jgi:hypothetical protein
LPRYCGAGQKRASLIFNWTTFILFVIIFMKGYISTHTNTIIIRKL